MPNPTFLQALDARRSVPSKQLSAPGPDDSTLLRMLTAASRVPDHGKLVPFRFLRISGDARHSLGETLAARTLALDPNAPPAAVEKDRARFSHAPVIIAVVARLTPGHKVPEQEQLLTAGSDVCGVTLNARNRERTVKVGGRNTVFVPMYGAPYVRDLDNNRRYPIGGIPGVLLAAFIVKSLPLQWLYWMVVVVVLYAAILMLRSAMQAPPLAGDQA